MFHKISYSPLLEHESDLKKKKTHTDRVRTSDAFWRSAHVLVSECSLTWFSFMPLSILFSNLVQKSQFLEFHQVCDRQMNGQKDGWADGRTDRQTDQRTDGPTDTLSCGDVRTHLKVHHGPLQCNALKATVTTNRDGIAQYHHNRQSSPLPLPQLTK